MNKKLQKEKIDKILEEYEAIKEHTLRGKAEADIASQHAVNLLNHLRDLSEDMMLGYISELKEKIEKLGG